MTFENEEKQLKDVLLEPPNEQPADRLQNREDRTAHREQLRKTFLVIFAMIVCALLVVYVCAMIEFMMQPREENACTTAPLQIIFGFYLDDRNKTYAYSPMPLSCAEEFYSLPPGRYLARNGTHSTAACHEISAQVPRIEDDGSRISVEETTIRETFFRDTDYSSLFIVRVRWPDKIDVRGLEDTEEDAVILKQYLWLEAQQC